MSIDRWMDKEAVVNIFNGISLSHKKGHIWLSSNKVKSTRAYYTSEASQKEKDKYHLLMQEDGTEEPICRATAETQTEQPCGYSGEERAGWAEKAAPCGYSGEERAGWAEKAARKHARYHRWSRWPVRVACMMQRARAKCSVTTQRRGIGWEVNMEACVY